MTDASIHRAPRTASRMTDRPDGRQKPSARTTSTTTHGDQSLDSVEYGHTDLSLLRPPQGHGHGHGHGHRRHHKPKTRKSHSMILPKSKCAVQLMLPPRGELTVDEFYPDPESAQQALEIERQRNPYHVRAPTPHVSDRRRQRSSSVSTHNTGQSEESDNSTIVPPNDAATVGPDEPHFGSARGIGPPVEATRVYGLGRKEPRHRKYSASLLKPALRTAPSREPILDPSDKPLPRRPSSFIVPMSLGSSAPSFPLLSQRKMAKGSPHASGLQSLFDSLSLAPREGSFETPFSRHATSRYKHLSLPPQDLFNYLRNIEIPSWTAWPGERDHRSSTTSLSLFQKPKGFDALPPAWHGRLAAAEAGRQVGRALVSWESTSRHWQNSILEWLDDNVPMESIDPENRWGEQIFALHSNGFDSLEFHDENADEADDLGLLSFINGSILQTAVSVLHMLRYSSQSFTFLFLSGSTSSPHGGQSLAPAMWDGIGTFVLINNNKECERAMIVEVRPPAIVDGATLREFAKSWRHEQWWQLPAQYCVGESGQANLLQAQVYDSCVQNQTYFFVVTNTKQWVFGHFLRLQIIDGHGSPQNPSYTKCWVSPVIERRQRDPNVMQCLVAWTVRAVDERPRRVDPQPDEDTLGALNRNRRAGEIYSYADEAPHQRNHRSVSRQTSRSDDPPSSHPYPQPPYNLSQTSFQGPAAYGMPPSSPPPMGEFGAYSLPGYYDLHPPMGSPHGYQPMNGYHTWAGPYATNSTGTASQYGGNWYNGFVWPGMR